LFYTSQRTKLLYKSLGIITSLCSSVWGLLYWYKVNYWLKE